MTHGLRVTYTYRGCRCAECTEANRAYRRMRRTLQGIEPRGRPKETAPANVCAICPLPISDHRPYYLHAV